MVIYYIDTDEIPGFFLLLKNPVFIALSEDTILCHTPYFKDNGLIQGVIMFAIFPRIN